MASKGQKFKKYSSELKDKILKEYFSGEGSPTSLSSKYDVPVETVWTWIKKTKKDIDVRVDHRPGNSGNKTKRKNLTLEDYKERYEILKNTRPSYKHDEGKSNVYNYSYKRIQII